MTTRIVGTQAPDFKADAVLNGEFKSVSLKDYQGKWKILLFYPLDFTFVCPTEITTFSDHISKFKELNCEVLSVSTDSKFSHLAWTKQDRKEGGVGNVKFPMVADFKKEISRSYGVLMEEAGIALRGLFIIDDKDVIQHSTINNLSVGRNVEETLRLLEAFQYTAKHGEVCPANWSKGQDSMKPTADGLKDWSKKHN